MNHFYKTKRPVIHYQFLLKLIGILSLLSLVTCYAIGQTIDQQASQRMLQYKNGLFFAYEGDNYSLRFRKTGNSPQSKEWEKVLYQFKVLKLLLVKDNITFADSLNGYKYKGAINIIASAVRSIRWSSRADDGVPYHGWYPWKDFKTVKVSIQNQNGKWYIGVGDQPMYEFPNQRPALEDVTATVNRPNDRGVSIPPVRF